MPGGGYGRFGRRIIGPIIVVAAALVLSAACSSGSSSTTAIPPPLRATATSSPSQAASVRPGKKSEVAAAEAVVRRYYALLNGQTSKANAAQLRRLMAPGCECRSVATDTQHLAAAGERYFGVDRISALRVVGLGKRAATVLVTYRYTRSGTETSAGRILTSSPGRVGVHEQIAVTDRGQDWLLDSIALIDNGSAR